MLNSGKKGAMELSVSTIVVIVLAMSMLILGLILVQKIFKSGTESVDILDEKVKGEINKLFVEEDKIIAINLPESTASIKAGTANFGISIAGKTPDGSRITSRDRLQYMLSLDKTTPGNCVGAIGEAATEGLFKQQTESYVSFDEYEGDSVYAIIEITVPSGTALCSQKVFIDIKDSEAGETIAGSSFIIRVERKGLF